MAERDPEIAAIEAVVAALGSLDDEGRNRVMAYVRQRLSFASVPADGAPTIEKPQSAERMRPAAVVTDIRTLREEKQPKTAQEMAAIVAYYLSELVTGQERRSEVATEDLEKYFKQAGHPLPGGLKFTLRNAASAGYFDALGGGRYKLNPVGHNLVAHTLPKSGKPAASPRKRATKTKAKSAATQKRTAKARSGTAKKS